MAGEGGMKRKHTGNNRRHDRNKFRRTTNATQQRKDLGNGLTGILISCTPRHENHAFREAVIMLGKYCDDDKNKLEIGNKKESIQNQTEEKIASKERLNGTENTSQKPESENADITKALQAELKDIRDPEQKLFTRVDGGVNGSVFLRINRPNVDIEKVVECALKDARASGSPNSRHCIRIMPIHITCYAKAEDAAKAAVSVVKQHFPSNDGKEKPVTYAISFKARLNTNAHRDVFITQIAKAIDDHDARYKVNLTAPDVTLIVEILKTSCCIGTFKHFYQLAKMNLREAASPSKPKEETKPAVPETPVRAEKQTIASVPESESEVKAESIEKVPKGIAAKPTPEDSTADGTDLEKHQKSDATRVVEASIIQTEPSAAQSTPHEPKVSDGAFAAQSAPDQTSDVQDAIAKHKK